MHPARTLAELRVPVLALYGGEDIQVLPAQADRMAAALADHPDATVRVLPGLDHLLGPTTGPHMGHYADPDRGIDPRVPDALAAFAARLCPPR